MHLIGVGLCWGWGAWVGRLIADVVNDYQVWLAATR